MMLKLFFVLLVATVCWAGPAIHVRPCFLDDYKCIRDNLAANSNCSRNVKGWIPKKYTLNEVQFEAPGFNSTYVDQNLIVRNHDKCFVSDFVINTKTATARLVVDCPQLDFESDRVLIQHESFKDDAFYYYHIRGTYPLIRFNLYMSKKDNMDLCKARVFSDVTAPPKFHIDPKDKPTKNFLTRDLTLLNVFEREAFFYRGHPIAMTFVDSLICDYSCPLRQPVEGALYY